MCHFADWAGQVQLARFHWLVYLWEHRDSKVKPCTISSKHSLVFFLWWQCQLQWRKLKPCQVDCWLMNLMAHIASRLIKSKQCELSWTSWHLKVLRSRNVVHVKALLISCPAQAQMQEILALRFQKGLETWPWPWLWQRRFVLGVVAIPVVLHHPQSLLPIPLWVTSHWKRFLLSGMTYLPSVTEWEMGSPSSWDLIPPLEKRRLHQLLKLRWKTWNSTPQFYCPLWRLWRSMTWGFPQSRLWLGPLRTSTNFARKLWGSQTMFTRKHGLSVGWLGEPRNSSTGLTLLRTGHQKNKLRWRWVKATIWIPYNYIYIII